jgi:hypothetical protein
MTSIIRVERISELEMLFLQNLGCNKSHNPEGHILHSHCHENLIFCMYDNICEQCSYLNFL